MSMPPPRAKKPTEYKRPQRFNIVSVTMLLMMAAGIYLVYCTWPLITLRLRVKGELEEVMNRYWRANLRGAEAVRQETIRLRKELTAKLTEDGVKDPKLELVFEGGKGRIAIEARFAAKTYFPGLDRTYVFNLAPRAETDSARVDW
jgi:hypothetical protein